MGKVEKAELTAQVAFLQGEQKGQQNLKRDLIRRIKMLEFALKQERQRYYKLKTGENLDLGENDSAKNSVNSDASSVSGGSDSEKEAEKVEKRKKIKKSTSQKIGEEKIKEKLKENGLELENGDENKN